MHLTNLNPWCKMCLTDYTPKGGETMKNRLKDAREAKGMSQEALAKKSGISRVTISAIENEVERNTTSNTLVKLAQALDTTVDKLFFTGSV